MENLVTRLIVTLPNEDPRLCYLHSPASGELRKKARGCCSVQRNSYAGIESCWKLLLLYDELGRAFLERRVTACFIDELSRKYRE
ncbi:hypothetical protein RND71_008332 [Anisodus tanguticus]|uniref:Uncharacterized protein n=1 Tax=Anisodus tanguticus TaxID=243964 RepID=A0AAE1SNX2_9SOLA|nr:hypothetical protein RND71_008332 [Anisodus tanguticus]